MNSFMDEMIALRIVDTYIHHGICCDVHLANRQTDTCKRCEAASFAAAVTFSCIEQHKSLRVEEEHRAFSAAPTKHQDYFICESRDFTMDIEEDDMRTDVANILQDTHTAIHILMDAVDTNPVARELITAICLTLSMCPYHYRDYGTCFHTREPECELIRKVHPIHDYV